MRILITGGCGFIGLPLTEACAGAGHDVLVLDNFFTAGPDRIAKEVDVQIEECDLRDEERTSSLTLAFRPDVIIHLAALHFIPYCDAHPMDTMQVNMGGTRSIMAAGEAAGAPPFILASSAAVYPASPEALSEAVAPGPMDIYGYSKWAAELLLEKHAARTGAGATALRLFNVFGPRETNPHLIPEIVEQLKSGDTLHLGGLDSRRDFIFVDDVVQAVLTVVGKPQPGVRVFNVGTGRASSVREVVDAVRSILGRQVSIEQQAERMRPVDRPVLLADTTRMTEAHGWRASTSLKQGLRMLLDAEELLAG